MKKVIYYGIGDAGVRCDIVCQCDDDDEVDQFLLQYPYEKLLFSGEPDEVLDNLEEALKAAFPTYDFVFSYDPWLG